MKIRICMKNPDSISDALFDAALASVAELKDISAVEKDLLVEDRREQLAEAITPWVGYQEYITVEIDTVAKTAVVLPAR